MALLLTFVLATRAGAQTQPVRPFALQATLQLGTGWVSPASTSGRGSHFISMEGSAWRNRVGLVARLEATTFPQVCSVILPVRCNYPSDVGVGLTAGPSVAHEWSPALRARIAGTAGGFRWSNGHIDPAAEVEISIDALTSPPIGLRAAAGWRIVRADETVSIFRISAGILALIW